MTTSAVGNAVAFQACWWAGILGAANRAPWLGPIAVAAFAVIHLRVAVGPGTRQGEMRRLAATALIGYVLDSTLVLAGVLRFPAHASLGWPSTIWMVALWVSLALTLRSSMSWMLNRPALAAIFGAVGGPLAYVAGQRLGAASLAPTLPAALVAVALEWTLAMPALVWLAGRGGRAATEGAA